MRDAVPDVCLLALGPLDEDKEYADECRAMIEDMDLEETVCPGRPGQRSRVAAENSGHGAEQP